MNLSMLAENDYGGWQDGGPPWPVFPLLVLLVIGTLITVAVLWTRRSNHHANATTILAERYARGELGDDEYRQRRALLNEKRG